MPIFNLYCQLVLRISGNTKICYIKTRPSVEFSLYLKKAGFRFLPSLLACSADFCSFCDFFFFSSLELRIFFTQNRRGGGPPGPFPRSATGMPGHRIVPDANQLHDSFITLYKVGYLLHFLALAVKKFLP